MPPSGQVNTSAPLSVVKTTHGVIRLTHVLDMLEERADAVIHLRHARLFHIVVVLGIHPRLVLGGR